MDLVERFVAAIENEDIEAYGELFAEDAIGYEPMFPEPAKGRDAIVAGEAALFDAFGDISIRIVRRATTGSTTFVEVVLSATNDGALDLGEDAVPATNRRIEVPMVWSIDTNDEGLIVEERDYFDSTTIMSQLGLTEG